MKLSFWVNYTACSAYYIVYANILCFQYLYFRVVLLLVFFLQLDLFSVTCDLKTVTEIVVTGNA